MLARRKVESPENLVEEANKVAGTSVRLICRYTNGVVKSFLSRAISFEGKKLQVLVNEQFEPGIPLTVMSTFLPASRIGRVMKVERGQQAGWFIVEVSLQPPVPVPAKPKATAQPQPEHVSFTSIAGNLAARLEAAGGVPYYKAAFETAAVSEKQAISACTAAAVFLLLSGHEMVDSAQVLMKTSPSR
jgi:hypothetical protein